MVVTSEDQTPRPDTLIGQTLADRYHLTRKIGEGGMGSVYEATHVVIGKPVAVKVLREKYLDRPNVAARLVQEARLASAIRHDHIIDIVDSGKTPDGRTFVVMELLDGQSLAELVRKEGPLPEARALDLARQVAGALGAAHARGIVHRDVKPENVFLLQRDGRDFVKVVDFGISTTVRDSREAAENPALSDAENRLTSTGMVLGTPFYMSPEQARGDEEIDHRIDIYALGVILYECLTGEVPFRGGNYLGIISRVLNETAQPPRALRPELRISEAAERVVAKAMAKNRDERYQTMDALAADLDRVLAGDGVEAPLLSTDAAAPRAETRVWVYAASAIVLAGGVALLWAGRTGRPVPPPQPPVVVAPPAPQPPAPAPSPSVVLHFETEPEGAEIRQGDRVFGKAPRDVILPRSPAPLRFGFVLDGYEPGSAEVTPASDDLVRVKLTARPKVRPRPHPHAAAVAEPAGPPGAPAPADTKKPNRGETLPNPY